MSISFVQPHQTRRLELSGGDWVEVRDRISYGAGERLRSISLKSMATEGGQNKIDIDFSTFNVERMLAYIVAWSARKPDGSPVKPDRDAFMTLNEAAATEIMEALTKHIADREEEAKAVPDGDPMQPAIEAPSYSVAG